MKTTLLSLALAILTSSAFAKVECIWMTHQSPDNSRIVIFINGTFGHDPQAAFSDKAASYQLLTLDREAGTLKAELKALEDGRVLDSKTITKRMKP